MITQIRDVARQHPRLVLLLLAAPLIIWALYSRDRVENRFSFAAAGSVTYAVTEELTMKEGGAAAVAQRLQYTVAAVIAGDRDQAVITFNRSNEKDPQLAFAMFPGTMEIKTAAGRAPACPHAATPAFPEKLLSLFYSFPAEQLFDGKKWQGSACAGALRCYYAAEAVDAHKMTITADCSGRMEQTSLIMQGRGVYDTGRSMYVSLDGSVDLTTPVATTKRRLSVQGSF